MIYWIHLLYFGPLLIELGYEDMSILGILVGPPPWGEEVIILIQAHVYLFICCELLVLLPLIPPGIHVVLEDWAWWGVVEFGFLPCNFWIFFPIKLYLIHPFFNMQVGFGGIMFSLRHLHFSILELMSENPAFVSRRTIFKMTKKIADPLSWVLKVYADLKSLNFRLESLAKELFIHGPIILELRRCW